MNGKPIQDETLLQNGDRIVIGSHHFFRLNCPKSALRSQSNFTNSSHSFSSDFDDSSIDYYNMAREEFAMDDRLRDAVDTAAFDIKKEQQIEEKLFKKSLSRLHEQLVRANSLVREANSLSNIMKKDTFFSVTFQIPVSNLKPNRKVINIKIHFK